MSLSNRVWRGMPLDYPTTQTVRGRAKPARSCFRLMRLDCQRMNPGASDRILHYQPSFLAPFNALQPALPAPHILIPHGQHTMSSSDPPDTKSCSLVGPVALVVQALMAVLVIASLLVKRQYEGNQRNGQRRRKWKVWMYDVGKQLIGQSLIHASNLLVSCVEAWVSGD